MSWIYKTNEIKDITQFPENTFGFVYIVTHNPTGKTYVGKKVIYHTRKQKVGKRELQRLQNAVGRRPAYKLVVKESDWKNYFGSQKEIVALAKKDQAGENLEKRILEFVPNKKLLTYYETKHLFINNVLEDNYSAHINDNILGKFYRKDFIDETK